MLVFDFDGVLINSLDEVVLTTYNAASESLSTSLDRVPADLVRMFIDGIQDMDIQGVTTSDYDEDGYA